MAHPFRFGRDDFFIIDGTTYRVSSNDGMTVCFTTMNTSDEQELCFTQDELTALLKTERFHHERNGLSKGKAAVRDMVGCRKLSEFSAKAISKALWRQKWCDAFDRRYREGLISKVDTSIRPFIAEMAQEVNSLEEAQQVNGAQAQAGKLLTFRKSPCPKSLLSWHRIYISADRDPTVLVLGSHRSGNRMARFCPETQSLLRECVQGYLDLNRPSKKKILEQTKQSFRRRNDDFNSRDEPALPVPSRSEVYREIERLSPFSVCAAREGIEKARRKFALFEMGNDIQYPLERVEIDEWKVDILSVATTSGLWKMLSKKEQAEFPRTRRWLYVAIDCATRCVVGLKVASQPSAREAVWVLDMITQDKTEFAKAAGAERPWDQFGGLELVVADNGASYANVDFELAVTAADGTAMRPPAGLPHLRAMIERVFGTFATDLMPLVPGRTYASSKERGDADPSKNAVLTDDFLTAMLVRYIVDIYHQSAHEGIGGDTPANRWKTLAERYGVMSPPSPNTRRFAFGDQFERTVRGNGVCIEGLFYNCAELRSAFLNSSNRRVQVRMDAANIGYVSVEVDGKWYSAKSVLNGLDGVNIHAWKAKKRELERHYRGVVELNQAIVDKALLSITQMTLDAYKLSHLMPDRVDALAIDSAKTKQSIGLREEPDFADAEASDVLLRNSIPVRSRTASERAVENIEGRDLRWRMEE